MKKNNCIICGIFKYIRAKNMCNSCYEKNRPHNICIMCKKYKGNTNRPICIKCYNKEIKKWKCNICGSNYRKHGIICRNCYEKNRDKRKCKKCGEIKKINGNELCTTCYTVPEKICSICNLKKQIYGNNICFDCYKKTDHFKKLRKQNMIRFLNKYPERRISYIKTRWLEVNKKCLNCGSNKNIEKHHPDYINEPHKVIPLCKKCHLEYHVKERRYKKNGSE
jgi:hypothetical protein